ncbi:universal stress protein [Nocardia aurantiaca]|uniref:Universal stress protein n=1 Tax=Nocardia aurantiaca TaxID=2675850 RepID=A0A6I3L0J6_9NOCA|nr:universal stress protein [Nocardia aurantiaca]MTE14300.1 universal stress protein [Nocardia aurantiaca]
MTTDSSSSAAQPRSLIIAAVDGSATSYQAAVWAAVEANLHGCGLHIVTSVSLPVGEVPGEVLGETDLELLAKDGQRIVDEASRVARAAVVGAVVPITTEVLREPIIGYLLERSEHVRTVAVGSRGLGAIRRGMLGSVADAVVRHAQCPVAVIHATAATDPLSAEKPVLVGIDGTPNSVPALEFAFEEASSRKVGLTALHAWTDILGSYVPLIGWEPLRAQENELLSERLAGFGERYPDVPVRRMLVMERPAQALLQESEYAQLVVVGTRGRGGFTGMLLGSTSSTLLHNVETPTVVIRT